MFTMLWSILACFAFVFSLGTAVTITARRRNWSRPTDLSEFFDEYMPQIAGAGFVFLIVCGVFLSFYSYSSHPWFGYDKWQTWFGLVFVVPVVTVSLWFTVFGTTLLLKFLAKFTYSTLGRLIELLSPLKKKNKNSNANSDASAAQAAPVAPPKPPGSKIPKDF